MQLVNKNKKKCSISLEIKKHNLNHLFPLAPSLHSHLTVFSVLPSHQFSLLALTYQTVTHTNVCLTLLGHIVIQSQSSSKLNRI